MANITTDQHFPNAVLSITDAHDRPAPVEGAPVWASSDETVLTVVVAVDGMSGDIMTVAPGTARITVTADADLGSGVETITGVSEDIVVTSGNVAKVMTLSLNEAVDKV